VAFAELKVAVVDLNKVLSESPQVSAAKNDLKKQFDPREKAIVEAQKKLQSDVKKYEKDNITMKEADLKKAQQKIMESQKKLQELQASFQKDLVDAQNKSMQSILKKVEEVIAKISRADHFDLVLTKMSVAYNNPSFDITAKVATEMKK
jgi:outer membrane protein